MHKLQKSNNKFLQESIPVECVPVERWQYSSVWSRGGGGLYPQRKQKSKKIAPPKIGGSPLNPPSTPCPPSTTHPPKKNWRPPRTDLQGMLRYPPLPPGLTCKACWDTHPTPPGLTCKACWDTHPPSPVDRMTHACENITLAKTSFSAGKNDTSPYV